MKFSVLIPTRNRLEFLKYAIHSVLNQDYDDWEIIIFDNFSEQNISDYIKSLNDKRVKYFRSSSFVPVTDNWNNALEKSSGEYVIMLGDDDCLMKNYFSTIYNLIKTYSSPDFIYTSGFIYAYPGVMPGSPEGFLNAFGNASFLQNKKSPFWLSKQDALKLVKDSLNFKVKFAYNMQYSIINKKLIEKLSEKGEFFQSPYPDYYATTALMLYADKILAYPKPIVTVGITPKSFGYYYFNNIEEQGVDLLNNDQSLKLDPLKKPKTYPGTTMNTCWMLAMQKIKDNFKDKFKLTISNRRYLLLQLFEIYKNWVLKISSRNQRMEIWKIMNWQEKIFYALPYHIFFTMISFTPKLIKRKSISMLFKLIGSHPKFDSLKIDQKYSNIQQVFEKETSNLYN